jgi:hypothetical protein
MAEEWRVVPAGPTWRLQRQRKAGLQWRTFGIFASEADAKAALEQKAPHGA